jgi:hypothetical protein
MLCISSIAQLGSFILDDGIPTTVVAKKGHVSSVNARRVDLGVPVVEIPEIPEMVTVY